ncbi:hypothetical protein [Xanthomonas theicola]|uniref:hypothetical protein n=1 Tax=Xanthomonas theicola TaxID=56464 RepID=UPI000FF88D43|nr:hypothetical protein [Xanthomonas theicola]QNH23675.1 hypothetical protein G4Q83_01300 [Xanthomonas theicola]
MPNINSLSSHSPSFINTLGTTASSGLSSMSSSAQYGAAGAAIVADAGKQIALQNTITTAENEINLNMAVDQVIKQGGTNAKQLAG